jgi:hypothetical protein
MTLGVTTALNLIQGALRKINSYQSGEPIAAPDASDCLDTLNDLLDSLSTDKQYIFGSNENILTWTAQKRQYSIGNPICTLVGSQPFTGTIGASFNGQTATSVLTVNSITSGVISVGDQILGTGLPANTRIAPGGTGTGGTGTYNLTTTPGTIAAEPMTSLSSIIAQVTNVPSNLIAGQNAAYTVGSGSILTDTQNVIPLNTTVTAIGASTVTMSAQATSFTASLDTISYTVPGDFPIPRPLRITHGYTRFNALDFTLDVAETETQYNELLYKAQPGPWPTVAWYNNQFPYGLLNAYQTPGNGAELHLFTDTILSNLTLNQIIIMPQGYSRMLKWMMAEELWPEYMGPVPLPDAIKKNSQEARSFIKALNARPPAVSRYDRELVRGNRPDAGFIIHGGYR